MRAYSIEKVVADNGTLQLEALPFLPGELVEVIVLVRKTKPARIRALKGSVIKYEQPLEPVSAEDWDALR
jgi:hypothetical protein